MKQLFCPVAHRQLPLKYLAFSSDTKKDIKAYSSQRVVDRKRYDGNEVNASVFGDSGVGKLHMKPVNKLTPCGFPIPSLNFNIPQDGSRCPSALYSSPTRQLKTHLPRPGSLSQQHVHRHPSSPQKYSRRSLLSPSSFASRNMPLRKCNTRMGRCKIRSSGRRHT